MVTLERLKELFTYNGSDLVNINTRGRAIAGSVAGTVNSSGYRHIKVDGKFINHTG